MNSIRNAYHHFVQHKVRRPIIEGRDGFVAFDPTNGAVTGLYGPGATVRRLWGPPSGLDAMQGLMAHGMRRVHVTFNVKGQSVTPPGATGAHGQEALPPAAMQRVLQSMNPLRGGLFTTDASSPSTGVAQAQVLALPRNYDGPVFVCDLDDTLRPTKVTALLAGHTQQPIAGVTGLLNGVAQLGVPIVYLSAGSFHLHTANEKFLSQLPPGVLLDRDQSLWQQIRATNHSSAASQGGYKASVLAALQQACPQVKLFEIGDDKYGDAIAYQQHGTMAYIHNVDGTQRNLPKGFHGVVTDDYNPAFEARVLTDLRNAIARSVSFGGNPNATVAAPEQLPPPPPIHPLSLQERLQNIFAVSHGLGHRVTDDLKQKLLRANDIVSTVDNLGDTDMRSLPAAALGALARDLLKDDKHRVSDAQASQFMRLITAQGTDAGHVDAVLSHVPSGDLKRLPGSVAEQFVALQKSHQAVPGDWQAWGSYVDAATASTARPGTRVEPLIDGVNAFPVMLEAIDRAHSTINVSMFAFQSDQTGWDFARHLADAAKRGVQVRLMYDEYGSHKSNHQATDPAIYQFLKNNGVQVISHPPGPLADHLDHRKIITVDGTSGFIGGMNVGDEYRYLWHDCMSRVTGPGVGDLQKLFVESWTERGGALSPADRQQMFPPLSPVPDAGTARIVAHTGLSDWNMKLAYLRAIDTATSSIHIADPYFSDPDVIAHLEAAAKRGVDVRIVLPKYNNHGLEQAAERDDYHSLIAAGAHIYEYYGMEMAHDKVATFDGRLATIGSSNLDARSLQNDDEANVWIDDSRVAQQLDVQLFAADQQKSNDMNGYQPGFVRRLVNQFGNKLRGQL
ncbi:MAG: phospholipase D-like domain-containing protein [Candidatus Xenobia bacterium]